MPCTHHQQAANPNEQVLQILSRICRIIQGVKKLQVPSFGFIRNIKTDAPFDELIRAARRCLTRYSEDTHHQLITRLCDLFTTKTNPNPVLILYTVRTGFHLFLESQCFPPGSELIMSAVNIPDMVAVARHHQLRVIPVDVDIDTLSVSPEHLEAAITPRTVAVMVAHIYGKWMDVDPLITIAHKHGLFFLEDCAEAFCGFEYLGHPDTDLALFSFGVIKVQTCFLGAVAKFGRTDLHQRMSSLYSHYPLQTGREYLHKLCKYGAVYSCLNVPTLVKPGMELTRCFKIDHQKYAVQMLRGFPKDPISNLCRQPSTALLATMAHRIPQFSIEEYTCGQKKAWYAVDKLCTVIKCVGLRAWRRNFWLFPVLVDDPRQTVDVLRLLGVDAYTGSTQLHVILPEEEEDDGDQANKDLQSTPSANTVFPHQAQYMINHVVYLPIHKQVPVEVVDRICWAVRLSQGRQHQANCKSSL